MQQNRPSKASRNSIKMSSKPGKGPDRRYSRRESFSSAHIKNLVFDVEEYQDRKSHADRLLERTFAKEDKGRIRELVEQKKNAKQAKEAAVKRREDAVNPVLIELLRTHYGIEADEDFKKKKNSKSLNQCLKSVKRLHDWQVSAKHNKEDLLLDQFDKENLECPFMPQLSNNSRYIMATKGDKVRKDIEKRRDQLEDERMRSPSNERGAPEFQRGKKMSKNDMDTFYKRVMDWNDTKERVRRQMIIDKLLSDPEHPDAAEHDSAKKKRVGHRHQNDYSQKLSQTKDGFYEKMEEIRLQETQGYFKPKTTNHIPQIIKQEIELVRLKKELSPEQKRYFYQEEKLLQPQVQKEIDFVQEELMKYMPSSPDSRIDNRIHTISVRDRDDISFTGKYRYGRDIPRATNQITIVKVKLKF